MARPQETKQLASRIDSQYVRKPDPRITLIRVLGVIVSIAAVLWVVLAGARANSAIYNPGPLSASHAMFQNDCSTCHAGNGHGGLSLGVSDAACLKCHSAAIHSANQATFIAMDSGGAMRSANCTHCHMEHHGRQAFMASDAHCTQCHAALSKHRKSGVLAEVPEHVTAFKPSSHPDFGVHLVQNTTDRKLINPPRLKFSHAVHNRMDAIKSNCSLCHHTDGAAGEGTASGSATASVRTVDDRRYMQPVNYDRDCKTCHPLQLSDKPGQLLDHQAMELVRAQLADARGGYQRWRLGQVSKGTTTPETASWLDDLKGDTESALNEAPDTSPGIAPLREALDAAANDAQPATTQAAPDTAPAAPPTAYPSDADLSRLEYRVAFLAKNRCSLCHELEGSTPIVLSRELQSAASQPATSPTTRPTLLATLPTGITPSPRHWLNANFSHDAHRHQSCQSCHLRASLTDDKTGSADLTDLLLPTIVSCVECHQSGKAPAAMASCAQCHVYHDRSLERPLASATTQPAATEPVASR